MNIIVRRSTNLSRFARRALTSSLALRTAYGFSHTKPLFTPLVYHQFSKAKEQYQTVNKSVDNGSGYFMEQLLTGCLSLYSYYIESDGEAIIIDPINQIGKYLDILKQRKAKLKYIALTHFHADYVAGHLELKKKFPDCEIVMGPKSAIEAYKLRTLSDEEDIKVGSVTIKLLHTPGHTEESSCFLLIDKDHKPISLFTGDTMFLNQVGRPDLAVKSDLTEKDLAAMLFDSINKIKSLSDHVKIYPGHGAGSSCGKNIGKGDYCTLDRQKQTNYALQIRNKEQFVNEILKGMPKPPAYFFNVVAKNKKEPYSFQQELKKAYKPLTVAEFKAELAKPNTHIIDIRGSSEEYFRGVIKGAYYIGHYGPFANFVGFLLDPKDNYLIFGDKELVEDAIKRLIRIGYLNVKGYNKFPISDWDQKNLIKYKHATEHDLHKTQRHQTQYVILDLRGPSEVAHGFFDGRYINIPITDLQHQLKLGNLPLQKEYLVHCASGYRAKIAPTILSKYLVKFSVLPESFAYYVQNGATVVKAQKVENKVGN